MLRFGLGLLFLFPVWASGATLSLRDLNPGDEQRLKTELPELFEKEPNQALLDEAIRVLLAHGAYENVFVERTAQGSFEIVGKPLRTVEEVQFNGLHEVRENDLRSLLDLKIGDRFDRKKVVAAAEKMKDYYGEHGFFNAVIELGFEKSQNQNIRLVFDIQEKAPCLIKTLAFATPNTDLKALLHSKFKSLNGKPLTTERMRRLTQDLTHVLIDGRYLAAEVGGPDAKYNAEKTEAYLQFEVREPYRWEFYFKGNSYFSYADIYHAFDLRNYERKNVDPASETSDRLRRAYLEKGFPMVQVETEVENPEGTFLKRVHYNISEGPRVKITGVEVQGRVSRSSKYYSDFVLANSSDLVADGFYNRADLDNGFKNLVTELHNQGFLRARMQSSRIEYTQKKDKVTVFLLLDEGPQTQIRGLDFTGNKFVSSFELAQVTGLRTNTPLRLDGFEDSLERLKTFYHNQGFLEMKLVNESQDIIQYNGEGTQARIRFQIYEGPRIRVNSITVEGNVKTKTDVILRETDFHLGEILTPKKLDDSTFRLNRMGLFSRADIRTLEENTNVADRTLIISVTERDPGTFSFGGGITSERNFTVRGFTAASYNNLWGTARGISGRAELRENVAEVRYPENEVTAGYLEPFLFNTRTRGRVNLSRSQYVYDYESAPMQGYTPADKLDTRPFTEITTKNRIDLLAERDLTQHMKLTYRIWSLESREDFERYGRCLPTSTNPNDPGYYFHPAMGKCPANVMQVAMIGPTLDFDYRDNPFLPTRGWFDRIGVGYSNPIYGSSQGVNFIKVDNDFRTYKSLSSPRWVWANMVRGGYESSFARNQGDGIPSDYSYVLGGIYTLRGFDYTSPNERVPKDGDDGFRLGETNTKLIHFDSFFYLVKTELRFPLYEDFGGVIFYDGGAVYVTGYDFFRTYRHAVGFGLRYNTPVGPVALDFAFKINPEGAHPEMGEFNPESPFRFYFSIGTF